MTFLGNLSCKQHRSDSPEFPIAESPIESLGGDGAKRRGVERVMSFDESGTRLILLTLKVPPEIYLY